jgi:hypothetical protein
VQSNVSRKPDRQQPNWQTWWSFVGPRLTQAEFRLRDDIVLAPLTEEEFTSMKGRRAPVLSRANPSPGSFVVSYPPLDEVQSRHRLQIDVLACDFDKACQLATEIADKLVLSLTLAVPSGRYYAELRLVRRADENKERTAWSPTSKFTILNQPEYLTNDDIASAMKMFRAVEQDSTAENAYVHLLSAWQLQSTSGAKPLDRSILQHYVLCIEAIVNGVMKDIRNIRYDTIRLEERKFATEFAASLPDRADKPEAIREASTKLREISMSNMLPSIEAVADILNLGDYAKNQSKDLYRLRSRSLSHPGRDKEAIHQWLHSGPGVSDICRADTVARAYLAAYCDYTKSKV